MHCVTNTQPLHDAVVGKKADPRRARSGMANMVPTSTNSATAITMIYPELKGKLNGMAVRVPLMYAPTYSSPRCCGIFVRDLLWIIFLYLTLRALARR